MANDTCLQMVSRQEIEIVKKLACIGPLDKPRAQNYSTYFPWTINYLLVGNPSPNPKNSKPLGAALFGLERVESDALEAGHFGIVRPGKVAAIAANLERFDLKNLARAYAKAYPSKLSDLDDFRPDLPIEEAAKHIVEDVRRLASFYRRAAQKGLGVVMYTA